MSPFWSITRLVSKGWATAGELKTTITLRDAAKLCAMLDAVVTAEAEASKL